MRQIPTRLLIYAAAAFALLVVAGSAQASDHVPQDWQDLSLGAEDNRFWSDVWPAGGDNYYVAFVNGTGLWLGITDDAGETWEFSQANATAGADYSGVSRTPFSDGVTGYSQVEVVGSRIVLGYHVSGNLRTCYTDDSGGNFTCNDLTHTYTGGRAFDYRLTSTTNWEVVVLYDDNAGGATRGLLYSTANSGLSWSTDVDDDIIPTHTRHGNWMVHWSDNDVIFGSIAAPTTTAGQCTHFIFWLPPGDTTWNIENTGTEGADECRTIWSNIDPTGEWGIVAYGWAPNGPNDGIVQMADLSALPSSSSWNGWQIGTVGTWSTSRQLGTVNLWVPDDNPDNAVFMVYGRNSRLVDDCTFDFYLAPNTTAFTTEALNVTSLYCETTGTVDDSSTPPRFIVTQGSNFTYSPIWYIPTNFSKAVQHNAINWVRTDWGTTTTAFVYAQDTVAAVSGPIREYTLNLGFVQKRNLCDALAGFTFDSGSEPSETPPLGGIGVSQNGNVWTYCFENTRDVFFGFEQTNDADGQFVVRTDGSGINGPVIRSEEARWTDFGEPGDACEFWPLTTDLSSHLVCDGDENSFCDPFLSGISAGDEFSFACSGEATGIIPQVFQPDWGVNVVETNFSFVGVSDNQLVWYTNDAGGTGTTQVAAKTNLTFAAATVCDNEVWAVAGTSLLKYTDNGTGGFGTVWNMTLTSYPLFTQLQPTKDCQYLIGRTSTQLYVMEWDTGDVLLRTHTHATMSGLPVAGFTSYDVDALNNYLYANVIVSGGDDWLYRFDLYNVTASLAGEGSPGSLNPSIMTDPWDAETLEDHLGTDSRASTSSGGGATVPVGGGAGTIFGDTDALDDSFGIEGSGNLFIGLLLILAFAGAGFAFGESVGMAAIGGLLGLSFATFLGFIPVWVVVLIAMVGAGLVAFRNRGVA